MSDSKRLSNSGKSRALNVLLPEDVYWQLRRCAIQSRMSLKEFMIGFCRRAEPVSPSVSSGQQDAPSDSLEDT